MIPRALSIFLLLMPAASPARATITQQVGGPGGSGFTIECPAGQAVVGIKASAGAWVDGMAILCKPPIGDMQAVGWAGGQGGGPQEVYCTPGLYVRGIFMTFTRGNDLPREFVNTIGIACDGKGPMADLMAETHCILSGDKYHYSGEMLRTCSVRQIGRPYQLTSLVNADALDCPGQEVLTGVHGRHGSYIDALGAICGPRPEVRILRLPIGDTVSEKPSAPEPVTNVNREVQLEHAGTVQVPGPVQIPPDPIKPSMTPVLIPSVLNTIGRCKSGFVWREASADDQVCVTPESRERVRSENSAAASRVDPAGAYGPNSCKAGFVWREAFSGDLVCVTPEVRALVREENAQAADRRL